VSRAHELAALALLAALTLAGALLWAREGLALWIATGVALCL